MLRSHRRWFSWLAALYLLGLPQIGLAESSGENTVEERGEQFYRDGHYEDALSAWETAARAGDADAAWRLAVALSDGVVTERDPVRAVRMLRVAAEAGHADAQVDLGTAFDRGAGVEASPIDAARWYRRAALQGHMAGQFNFASMCEQGQGVERDLEEAWAWYSLSVRQGIGKVGDAAVARISDRMTEAQREAAAARAQGYEAQYIEGVATSQDAGQRRET